MTTARLQVEIPDGIWVGDVSRAHPDVRFHVLAAIPDEDAGYATVRIAGTSVSEAIDKMRGHRGITELTVLQEGEGESVVHFRTNAPLLLMTAQASGIPINLPVNIHDGTATLEVTGARSQVSQLTSHFQTMDVEYTIDRIRETPVTESLLTERQQEVLHMAIEKGYYAVPRSCALTDLANDLGIAKSTCSEILQRIEANVMQEFAG